MKSRQKVIKPGDVVTVAAYKHDGSFHRNWSKMTIVIANSDYIIGIIDQSSQVVETKKSWKTLEPSVVYFSSKNWFNIIAQLTPDGINYYCNLASPYVYEHRTIKYIDYDLDIKVKKNLNYKIVDQIEFERHKVQMKYPEVIENKILENLNILTSWIENLQGPFTPGVVRQWYGEYEKIKYSKN